MNMKRLNDFRLIIRNLVKNRTVTLLNIIGLTVGITVSVLILFFVVNQNSTDRFIPDIDNIYCITNHGETHFSQKEINFIKEGLPELEAITYCSEDWSAQVFLKTRNQSFKTEKLITADSCFFRVFDFKTVYGNAADALNTSNKIVLTRSFSEKIFGKINPVGKTLVYNSTYLQGELLEVTAVIEDLPLTSSWDFEAVLSFQTNYHIDWYVSNMNHWGTRNYKSFVKVNQNVGKEEVIARIKSLPKTDMPEWVSENLNISLFPFSDVYFELPEMSLTKHGNRLTVSIIGITGLLILLLACINYVNMVTAQREKRFKTFGIIKIMGGSRLTVIEMVTAESVIQVLMAICLSIPLMGIMLPVFKTLTSLNFNWTEFLDIKNILLLFSVFAVVILITGLLPGIIVSKKSPIALFKLNSKTKGNKTFRNGLLVFQFTVTIALIASILMVKKQNDHLQNQNLGFMKSKIIYAHTNDALFDSANAFKDEIARIPGVSDITYSESVLIQNSQNWGRDIINKGERKNIHFSKLSIAPNFFHFFGIPFKEGRNFNKHSIDRQEFIFNAAAQQLFELANINEANIATEKPGNGKVVGIIEDYNFESLHVPIRAAGFMCSDEFDEVIYLKLSDVTNADVNATLKEVEQVWNQFSPDFPFEYEYLDKKWESNYTKEVQFQKIISYTAFISIMLSCLGLIGLTFFVMEQRTKEIGIRKVNGAKIYEILALLNMNFARWLMIAFVIACPITWYGVHKWLDNFAYKTTISWWVFAVAGLLAFIIAMLTVSMQSWRAARRNPVEALRYE